MCRKNFPVPRSRCYSEGVGGGPLNANAGVKVRAILTGSGAFLLEVTGDLADFCDGVPSDCADGGTYTATATQIALEEDDPIDYTIVGSIMTIDDGSGLTITFSRVGGIPSVPSEILGTWEAMSLLHDGADFIADGMTLEVTTRRAGTYITEITGDLSGECNTGPDCIETGTYTATATHIMAEESGQAPDVVEYTVQGSTLTLIDHDGPGSISTLIKLR